MTVPVIKTRRLTLGPITLDDVDGLALGLRDWDVVQWLTAVPFPYSRKDAEFYVTQVVPTARSWGIDAGEGIMGVISLNPHLGYWLAHTFHGQHIMTEASEAIVTWYFDQSAETLVSGHNIGNAASRRVLSKLGFVDTQMDQELQKATNEMVPVQKMELTKSAWTARNA